MHTNYYNHLKVSQERAKEGIRMAELARHKAAARVAGESGASAISLRSVVRFLSMLVYVLKDRSQEAERSGSIILPREADRKAA